MSLYFYPDPRWNPRPRKTWVPGLANPGSRMMDKVGLGLLYTCIYIFRASEVSCAPKLLEACDRRA